MAEQMFKIVVADDEDELREAMCRLIDWKSLGFQLVGSAGNGLDALQLVEQLQPDLLLTDIQMPFIAGTSLAHQVRELQPLIQVAFLSGYDDFAYARSAIEDQVIAYLLKPISMAELTQALREIHRKMEERFRYFAPEESAGENLPQLVTALLLDTFSERREETELADGLRRAGFALPPDYNLTVLATQPDAPHTGAARTVDRVMGKYYAACSAAVGGRILTLLAAGADGFSLLGMALDELSGVLRRFVAPSCEIGVSRRFATLGDATFACREAIDAQRLGGGADISYSQLGAESGERRRDGVSVLCEQALRIIEQRYMDEELSLGSVSQELHVSPNYLSANMKKYAGDTFINLLIKRRMEAAQSLIAAGGMKIGEVAQRCGYSDQHYFSFCFKKYYGVSPARMRRGEEGQP